MVQFQQKAHSQRVTLLAASDYMHITIGTQGNNDFTKGLILLHEMYNGSNLAINYAIGTITAKRGGLGAENRIAVAEINTSSAYQNTAAELTSITDGVSWKLKSCIYNGKKYLALDIPYSPPRFQSYKFSGWTLSSGQNMFFIPYEINGQPVNQTLISEIQDFNPTMQSTKYARTINFMGNVGIGTTTPTEKLAVNGVIRAKEIKLELTNWPNYVFGDNYDLRSLNEVEKFIKTNKHLPGMPDQKQVGEEGVNLGEMNRKLLEKVEELTLHLISEQKARLAMEQKIASLQEDVENMKIIYETIN